ncbi:hypothetical protein D3C87_1252590 [compost metagenome]
MPQRIERVVFEQDDGTALPRKRLFQPLQFSAGMQPWIDPEPKARSPVLRQPDGRRGTDQITTAEHRLIDLRLQLRGIATIDKHHRLCARYQRNAGRAGKSGQP